MWLTNYNLCFSSGVFYTMVSLASDFHQTLVSSPHVDFKNGSDGVAALRSLGIPIIIVGILCTRLEFTARSANGSGGAALATATAATAETAAAGAERRRWRRRAAGGEAGGIVGEWARGWADGWVDGLVGGKCRCRAVSISNSRSPFGALGVVVSWMYVYITICL
jgi:hypothetical protein